MIEWIYSENTEILMIANSNINEKYYNSDICIMHISSVSNELV